MKTKNWKCLFGLGLVCVCTAAQATLNISSLDTGAGLYGANNTPAVLIDPNWTVSLLTSTGTPPGGLPSGAAYLVPNNIGFPIPPWVANDSSSSWLTYANPQLPWFNGPDYTGGTYQYQLQFIALDSGTVAVSWLSDNPSQLFLNSAPIGSAGSNPLDPTTFEDWTTMNMSVTAGLNTVDLDVFNTPYAAGNPTGGRVEFSGAVDVSTVPEPATMISAALLLLPFGAGTLQSLRKKRAA